jgi:CHAD domain-containing protein
MVQAIGRSELLKRRVDRFTRVLAGVEQGDVRALHRARVATRRLRELIPVLQLDVSESRKLVRRLRKVTRRLGAVRELDVLLLLIDEMHVSSRARASALGRVGIDVANERDRTRKRLFEHRPVDALWRLAGRLERATTQLQLADAASKKTTTRSVRWALDARVAQRASRLSAAVQDAGALYLPDRLHTVRIALKKMRYALELSNEVHGRRGDADLRALMRAQDLLGRMHDVQVLIDRVRELQASLSPPSVSAWRDLDALVGELEDDCRRLHARYMRARDDLVAIVGGLGMRHDVVRARDARRAG